MVRGIYKLLLCSVFFGGVLCMARNATTDFYSEKFKLSDMVHTEHDVPAIEQFLEGRNDQVQEFIDLSEFDDESDEEDEVAPDLRDVIMIPLDKSLTSDLLAILRRSENSSRFTELSPREVCQLLEGVEDEFLYEFLSTLFAHLVFVTLYTSGEYYNGQGPISPAADDCLARLQLFSHDEQYYMQEEVDNDYDVLARPTLLVHRLLKRVVCFLTPIERRVLGRDGHRIPAAFERITGYNDDIDEDEFDAGGQWFDAWRESTAEQVEQDISGFLYQLQYDRHERLQAQGVHLEQPAGLAEDAAEVIVSDPMRVTALFRSDTGTFEEEPVVFERWQPLLEFPSLNN